MSKKRALARPLMVAGMAVAILGIVLGLLLAARRGQAADAGRLVAVEETIVWEDTADAPHPGGPVTLRFVLRNEGGQPVKIRDASSSCGCATPRIETMVVAPGEECPVLVDATPLPVGEQDATVTLTTDSDLTPTLTLTATMRGYAKPPFLLQAGGDMTYLGEAGSDQERGITVITVEPEGESREPIIENPNDFLEVGKPKAVTAAYTTPGVDFTTYTYRVTLRGPLPEGRYSGEVTVIDPWDDSRRERLRVVSESVSDIRAIPSQLAITAEAANDPDGTNFIVVLKDEGDAPAVVELSEALGASAEARPVSEERNGALVRFNLRPKSGSTLPPGKHSITVRPKQPSVERLVIPVVVAEG